MISILIIGKGNVGYHLYNALLKVDTVQVNLLNSRDLKEIPNADITVLAVSDDAIAEVSAKINNRFVVHTSGSFAMQSLKNTTQKGVFYMLQTFSKEKPVDFSNIPFCLEASNKNDFDLLQQIALLLGNKIYKIDSAQRKILHAAAVFVNNFTNHMYKIGHDLCTVNQIPFEVLHPLIQETALKINTLSPEKAQTGPAIRKDRNTIENHLTLLNKKQREIYKLLTKSIQNGN